VQSIRFIPFWTCILCLAGRIRTGTPTMRPTIPRFGTTKTTKTGQFGCGKRSQRDTRTTHGLVSARYWRIAPVQRLVADLKRWGISAGYNPINEPCDPEHVRLPVFYKRFEKAIRAVDPDHILWLDGNTFSMEWIGFDDVLPNCVYALHDYSVCSRRASMRYMS
jgi:hypothetical protein